MIASILSTTRGKKNNNPQRSLRTKHEKSAVAVELRELLTRPGEISHWLVGACINSMGMNRLIKYNNIKLSIF
jgi:hypothetical protein